MTEEANRHRLSMAVFYDPDALWTTSVELLSCGFAINQQCCAGRALVLSQLAPPSRFSQDLAAQLSPLVSFVEPFVVANGTKDIVATSGNVFKLVSFAFLGRGEFGSSDAVKGQSSLSREGSRATVRHHIDAGAVLLIVSAENARQLVDSSHVLLRISPHSIQTFEFTMPSQAVINHL